ncbi:MAG TPA: hypothetical protein VGN19_08360 [Pedococcus sp.]|nr:hypothetical protein [Pedococcus sp.]
MNDLGPGARTYLRGAAELTAVITLVREIPNRSAIRAFATPSGGRPPQRQMRTTSWSVG